MKNIVVLASVELGISNAPAIHILSMVRELAALGYQVTLIAPRPSGAMPIDVPTENINFDFTPNLVKWRLPNSFNSLAQFMALWRHRKKHRLYTRTAPFSLLTSRAARLFGYKKLVVEVNGWFLDEVVQIGWPRWLARLISWLQVREAHGADALRVVTIGLKNLLTDEQVAAEKIAVIGNGSNINVLKLADKQSCRADLGLQPDAPYFIFVGNLWPANDLPCLFVAIRLLRDEGREVRCLVVGDGISAEAFKLAAKKAGVFEHTIFTGMVTPASVNLYLNAADVAVLPSDKTYYGKVGRSPLKLGDYTAAGKPVVATTLPGIDELSDQPWMFVTPTADPAAMAVALQKAYTAMSPGVAKSARQYAEGNFSWQAIAAKTAALLNENDVKE